ncbi:2-polyprenyl-6-methoxyphenol hydroxylase-like FAD-dependent oxidoreductase [Streptacidiphilus sp. MAP12-16]|uniref:NAD(P)/FAD-dependent oxidoreductase n=1 Tax=Streptacidiphilus sp. MAP12-16 TaxID=3156300 RepID=UPI0035156C7C
MTNRTRAVVVGASMAGLFAAAALADSFDEVTVIERDVLVGPVDRRGVPQGKHLHGLQAGGLRSLSDLFPGFEDDLANAGAVRTDVQSDIHWYLDGCLVKPEPSGLIGYASSRRLLEHIVRTRVRALPRVHIRDGWDVLDLTTTADRRTVTGVRLSRRADGAAATEVRADLVVDASGRASRSPQWVTELGFAAPEVTRVQVDITYVTRQYRREQHHLDGRVGTSVGVFPGSLHGGTLLAMEDNTFMFTAGAVYGQEPPMNDADLPAYVEGFASRDFADFLKTAEQITEPVRTRFPASIRAHYEHLADFPEGYLVVGDAVCSFNPVYGQGMSVAAAEAVLLRDLLRADRARLAERFFAGATEIIDIPWAITVNADLRFPEAGAPPTEEAKQFNAYLRHVYQAASTDADVGAALLRVIQLVDAPDRLLEPTLVERVMRALPGT